MVAALLSLSMQTIVYAEPKLDDLELSHYSLYSTATIDLHDAIKDPGNEYKVTWYADLEQVDEVIGLFPNQYITYNFSNDSWIGKSIYAKIESYNTGEVAYTEKIILQPASGNVILSRDSEANTYKIEYSGFDKTTSYKIKWYLDGVELPGETTDKLRATDEMVGSRIHAVVTSEQTGVNATSNNIIVSKVKKDDFEFNGSWMKNFKGKRWYLSEDGSHPYGKLDDNGNLIVAWKKIDNIWYAFDDMGYEIVGWVEDLTDGNTYYTSEDGLVTGWKEIGNNWYYFNTVSDGTLGKLFKGTTTPDGYTVDDKGIWVGNEIIEEMKITNMKVGGTK